MPDVYVVCMFKCPARLMASMCRAKMAEPVRCTRAEPEAKAGDGTSSSFSGSSEFNPKLLLELLRARKRS